MHLLICCFKHGACRAPESQATRRVIHITVSLSGTFGHGQYGAVHCDPEHTHLQGFNKYYRSPLWSVSTSSPQNNWVKNKQPIANLLQNDTLIIPSWFLWLLSLRLFEFIAEIVKQRPHHCGIIINNIFSYHFFIEMEFVINALHHLLRKWCGHTFLKHTLYSNPVVHHVL